MNPNGQVSEAAGLEAEAPFHPWQTVRRRKGRIFLGVLAGLALAALFHQVSGPWYEATGQVLVVKKHLDTAPISGPTVAGQPVEDYLPSHMLIVSSPRIVGEAVKEGRLLALPSLRQRSSLSQAIDAFAVKLFGQGPHGRPEDSLTKSIVAQLKVTPETAKPGSFGVSHEVMYVSFYGKDPDACGRVLSAVFSSYERFLKERYRNVNSETVDLVTRIIAMLEQEIKAKENAYHEFRLKAPALWRGKEGNSTTIPEDRVFSLDTQLRKLRWREAEIRATLRDIDGARKAGRSNTQILQILSGVPGNREILTPPSQLAGQMDEMNPAKAGRAAQQTIEEQLINLQLEERKLALKGYGPKHPDVLAVHDRIERLRSMLTPGATAEPPGKEAEAWAATWVNQRVQLLKQELADIQRTQKSLAADFDRDQKEAKEVTLYKLQDESLSAAIERSRLLYQSTLNRLEEIQSVRDYGGYDVQVLTPPEGKRYQKKYLLVFGLACFLGLLAGLGWGALAELRDNSFRTPQEIRYLLASPVLGQIPLLKPWRPWLHPVEAGRKLLPASYTTPPSHSLVAEAYRGVRTALCFSGPPGPPKVVQITSPWPGDGKTTLVAHLGVSLAQASKRVLLVDADLRQPSLHVLFALPGPVGLAAVLAGKADPSEAIQQTSVPGLEVLASGACPRNPAELLTSPRLQELLDTLRERYDFILVDTPPVLAVTDPRVVAPRVDGVILALRNSKNARPQAQEAQEILGSVGAKVLGVVLNGVRPHFPVGGYGVREYQVSAAP